MVPPSERSGVASHVFSLENRRLVQAEAVFRSLLKREFKARGMSDGGLEALHVVLLRADAHDTAEFTGSAISVLLTPPQAGENGERYALDRSIMRNFVEEVQKAGQASEAAHTIVTSIEQPLSKNTEYVAAEDTDKLMSIIGKVLRVTGPEYVSQGR